MKSILMPIRPIWCAKILNGEKTIEVRKTAPKDWLDYLSGRTKVKPEPRTVYIYCSKSGALYIMRDMPKEAELYGTDLSKKCFKAVYGELKHEKPYKYDMSGHVIAKYTLKEIEPVCCETLPNGVGYENYYYTDSMNDIRNDSSLDNQDLRNYLSIGKDGEQVGFAWHISDLEIFDEPKKLWEFEKVGSYNNPDVKCKKKEQGRCNFGESPFTGKWVGCEKARLTKAPQSWCYVEEMQ